MNVEQAKTLLAYNRFFSCSKRSLLALKNAWRGETVFCLGSGPSVQAREVERFQGRSVIYLNNAVKLHEKAHAENELCVITDHLRMLELRDFLISRKVTTVASTDKVLNPRTTAMAFEPPVLFVLPKIERRSTSKGLNLAVSAQPGFSDDLLQGVFLGKSVLFVAMQVAVYLGAKQIVLCGIDMTNNQGVYFDPSIRSNWDQFSYERDARPHFARILPQLRYRRVHLAREFALGRLSFLPEYVP